MNTNTLYQLTEIQRQRIENGAKLLDWQHPSWAQQVNLETFDINECRLCAVGQLFGSYTEGLKRLDMDGSGRDVEYGFWPHTDEVIGLSDHERNQITAAKNAYWKELIRQRQVVIKGEAL